MLTIKQIEQAHDKVESGVDFQNKFRKTKQFMAVAILLVAEQGKLSLDDTLYKYYSDYSKGESHVLKK